MTENTLSIFQCDFRKRYSTQHALIAMIEKARKILNKSETFGTLLTDLSKAFDCMTHDLLIAKLHALNFDMNGLNLIFDYLTGRKQRVKINSSFSSYLDIFQGVPQGPILGSLLFKLFISVTKKRRCLFEVQKLNYFPIRDFHRTLQIGKLLLEFYNEFFQFYDITFFYRTSILEENS